MVIQPIGSFGIPYDEIRNTILAGGDVLIGRNTSTSGMGQIEGRGISNFLMKRMGKPPTKQTPSVASNQNKEPKKNTSRKNLSYHPLKYKINISANIQNKINVESSEEIKQENNGYQNNQAESTNQDPQIVDGVSNKFDIENNIFR